MARRTADPLNLDYAENTTGTFRNSGGAGRYSVDPNDPNNVIGREGGDLVNYRRAGAPADQPMTRSPLSALPARGLYPPSGANPQRFVPSTPAAVTAGAPAAAAVPGALPAALATGNPLDILNGLGPAPTFGDVNLQSSPPAIDLSAPGPVAPLTGAERAGAGVRSAIGNVVDPTVAALGKGELAAADATTGFLSRWGARPIAAAGRAVAGFGRGLTGKSTAAGVSNASAAGFTTPTKEQPTPVTPTTPTQNVDKSESSLARFGVSDKEFNNRKRLAFAGF